jgi:hypothetical protein
MRWSNRSPNNKPFHAKGCADLCARWPPFALYGKPLELPLSLLTMFGKKEAWDATFDNLNVAYSLSAVIHG